jgi:shikimate dehydrogenase
VRTFGLIGYPLSHSFSEKYFTEKFVREKIRNTNYQLFPIDSVEKIIEIVNTQPQICGLNVTIPYKETVIPFLDELDPTATIVGAVNCIRVDRAANGKIRLKGYNTDVAGFRQSIKPFLASQHERALILGTGGASKAVEYVLAQIGVDCIFVSREKTKLSGKTVLSYEELNEYVFKACKLIVNTTPVGLFPHTHSCPRIPYHFIGKDHFLYDLIYNPAETLFLTQGKQHGALILNGIDMLKMQAEAAWEIWNRE